MKYLFILLTLANFGCNTPTKPEVPTLLAGHVAPGTFIGSWRISDPEGLVETAIYPCTAYITEVDSGLSGTFINDSTGELLHIAGTLDTTSSQTAYTPHVGSSYSTVYYTSKSLNFDDAGDSLTYEGNRLPEAGRTQLIYIKCLRNQK